MGEQQTGPSNKEIRYEGDAIILDTRLGKVEREQAESKARDEKYKDAQLKVNRKLAWFTGLLVLCSAISGAVSMYQAHIANITADAARQTAEAAEIQASAAQLSAGIARQSVENTQTSFRDDQRAWIAPVDFSVSEFREGSAAKFTIHVSNSGKTPALRVTTQISSAHGSPRFKNAIPHYGPELENQVSRAIGVLLPNAKIVLEQTTSHPITNIERYKGGTEVYWVFGRIDYQDVFQAPSQDDFLSLPEHGLDEFLAMRHLQ